MSEKTTVNPISLELFRSALTAIAEEMGVVLTRSSYSPNIKERRDFSCALFDLDGRLVAQAAHIPVHLGSMPDSVASALDTFDHFSPGGLLFAHDVEIILVARAAECARQKREPAEHRQTGGKIAKLHEIVNAGKQKDRRDRRGKRKAADRRRTERAE